MEVIVRVVMWVINAFEWLYKLVRKTIKAINKAIKTLEDWINAGIELINKFGSEVDRYISIGINYIEYGINYILGAIEKTIDKVIKWVKDKYDKACNNIKIKIAKRTLIKLNAPQDALTPENLQSLADSIPHPDITSYIPEFNLEVKLPEFALFGTFSYITLPRIPLPPPIDEEEEDRETYIIKLNKEKSKKEKQTKTEEQSEEQTNKKDSSGSSSSGNQGSSSSGNQGSSSSGNQGSSSSGNQGSSSSGNQGVTTGDVQGTLASIENTYLNNLLVDIKDSELKVSTPEPNMEYSNTSETKDQDSDNSSSEQEQEEQLPVQPLPEGYPIPGAGKQLGMVTNFKGNKDDGSEMVFAITNESLKGQLSDVSYGIEDENCVLAEDIMLVSVPTEDKLKIHNNVLYAKYPDAKIEETGLYLMIKKYLGNNKMLISLIRNKDNSPIKIIRVEGTGKNDGDVTGGMTLGELKAIIMYNKSLKISKDSPVPAKK